MASFRQIEALHSVIEAGTVTAAARRLGVSQPAVSTLIGSLERETGLRLFERAGGRLRPTPDALALFGDIDTVVRGLDRVAEALGAMRTLRAGRLSIGCSVAVSLSFLPGVLARFLADRPEVTVSVQPRSSPRVQEWIAAGLIEVGLVEAPVTQAGLAARPVQVECRCVAPAWHRLAGRDRLTAHDLADEPLIALTEGHMTTRRLTAMLEAIGRTPRIRCSTHVFASALAMARRGLGLTVVDPFTLDAAPGPETAEGFVALPLDPPLYLDLALVHAEQRPLSALSARFLDEVEAALGALGARRG